MTSHTVAFDGRLQLRVLEEKYLAASHALSAAVGWPHRSCDWYAVFKIGKGVVICHAMERVLGTTMRSRSGRAPARSAW
jgi:hypothetical protein